MFVTVVGVGHDGNFSPLENATWESVEQAIRHLNGEDLCDVLLGIEAEAPQMMICGGEDGKNYLCTVTHDGETYYTLTVLQPKDNAMILIACGGVEGAFPSHYISDLENVIIAAKTFYEQGERDISLNWTIG